MLLEYNNQINFTSRYSSIKIDQFNLVLFPEFKNYFVTDDKGMDCFQKLYDGMSIGDAFEHYSSLFTHCTEEEIRHKYQKLLGDIVHANKHTEPFDTADEILDIKFDMTYKCNAECVHCFATDFPDMMSADADTFCRAFDELLNTFQHKPKVAISGGEPLLNADLLTDFVRYIKPNTAGITLLTNGFLISDWLDKDESKIYFLLDNISDFQISLDGFTEEVFDKIRGDGNFKKVMNTLYYLNEKGISLNMHTTVTRINEKDIRENFIPFLIKNHSLLNDRNHFSFSIARAVGRGKDLAEQGLICSYTDFEKLLFDVHTQLIKNHLCDSAPMPITFREICGIGKQITVSPDGSCYLCGIPTSEILGNVLTDGYELIKQRTLNTRTLYHLDKFDFCKGCDVSGLCMGGCRVYNKTLKGDYCVPACNDDYKESIYRMLIREYEIGMVNI